MLLGYRSEASAAKVKLAVWCVALDRGTIVTSSYRPLLPVSL